jgi:hypothetical protein
MNSPMNVFVTEGNVEIYLSKAYTSGNAVERDRLLRLLRDEEDRMGAAREHLQNGERRIDDCEQRLAQQRVVVCTLRQQQQDAGQAELLLETFERMLLLLRGHQRVLVERFQRAKL